MALGENSCICLHMQLIAILSQIGVLLLWSSMFCFLIMYYNKLDARFQYRFQYRLSDTGVSYRWYWSFT